MLMALAINPAAEFRAGKAQDQYVLQVPNDSECEDAELDDFLSFLNGNDLDAFDAFAGMPIGLGAGKAPDVPAGSPQPDVCAALQQEIGASQPYDILHQHGSVDSTLSRSLLAADKGKSASIPEIPSCV